MPACNVSQDCCSQSPCPWNRPLLTHSSAGDTHSKAGLAQSLVEVMGLFPGSWSHKGFVCALQAYLAGMTFDFKCNWAPPTILLGLLLWSWTQSIFFFWWDTTLSCQQLVTILVFSQKINTHPSTLPSFKERANLLLNLNIAQNINISKFLCDYGGKRQNHDCRHNWAQTE